MKFWQKSKYELQECCQNGGLFSILTIYWKHESHMNETAIFVLP